MTVTGNHKGKWRQRPSPCDTRIRVYMAYVGMPSPKLKQKGMSKIMKEPRITVRPTTEENQQIQRRAKSANLSVNRYMIESALHSVPRNDRQLSRLMGQLCTLENYVRGATNLYELQTKVNNWRHQTMKIMECCWYGNHEVYYGECIQQFIWSKI